MHYFIMISSTVTQRGQTTIPRQIRDALHVEAGTRIIYEIVDGAVVIRTHPGATASFGALKPKSRKDASSLKDARARARNEWADHASKEGRGR